MNEEATATRSLRARAARTGIGPRGCNRVSTGGGTFTTTATVGKYTRRRGNGDRRRVETDQATRATTTAATAAKTSVGAPSRPTCARRIDDAADLDRICDQVDRTATPPTGSSKSSPDAGGSSRPGATTADARDRCQGTGDARRSHAGADATRTSSTPSVPPGPPPDAGGAPTGVHSIGSLPGPMLSGARVLETSIDPVLAIAIVVATSTSGLDPVARSVLVIRMSVAETTQ